MRDQRDRAICHLTVLQKEVLSHGGRTIFASDAPSSQLWVATADGLYLLTRFAKGAWEISRKVLEGRHVSAMDMHGDVFVAGMHKEVLLSVRTEEGRGSFATKDYPS